MLKLWGSILVLGAAFWGFWEERCRAGLQRRLRGELLAALRHMAETIRLARMPLPLLLYQEEKRCKTAAAVRFFHTVAQAAKRGEELDAVWQKECEGLPLSEEERKSIQSISAAFGGDEEQFCRAIALAVTVLQRGEEEMRTHQAEEEKRSAALWLSAGALTIILLI